ncbi:MAG TPA: Wzz/FepE/Etk N-terminal domain-containing protein, partial [Longimicrobiaceae bacterium]|nr:Wzz/FepE/Etk N-terminal domain-containing protein [Longimicrobiaceae bacterium]
MSDLVPGDRRPPVTPNFVPSYPLGAGVRQEEGEGESMGLRDVFGALRRHVLLVLAITAVVTALAVYFSAQAQPTYRAAAVVRVIDVRTALTGGLGDPWSANLGGALLSQIHLLRSRGVVAEAVDAQGLRLQSRTGDFSVAELKDVRVAEQAPSDTLRLRFTPQGVTAS